MRGVGDQGPVFIHALFRTGSTYLFHAVRRLGTDYTCYQEPLHEIALKAKEDKTVLTDPQDVAKARELRHPELNKTYFSELYDVADQCLPYLAEHAVYGGYFEADNDSSAAAYWEALIEASPGRPIIQECRSSGRIGLARQRVGGFHAYLWRNPWDQWWSYQVSAYFDLTTQLIFNAANRPLFIKRVSELVGFTAKPELPLNVAYDWYAHRPLNPDGAYQAFYALWLLALREGVEQADILINIDQLSSSSQAREHVVSAFSGQGLTGLDFDDCCSPVSVYTEEESQHFRSLEAKVHELWREVGLPGETLDHMLDLRQANVPVRPSASDSQGEARELSRYRDLLKRWKCELAASVHAADGQLQVLHRREDALRGQLEQHLAQLEKEKQQHLASRDENRVIAARLQETETELQAMFNSRSWRLTAPIRKIAGQARTARPASLKALASYVRSAAGDILKRLVFMVDQSTRSHPKCRHALLVIMHRSPWLVRHLNRMRQAPQPLETEYDEPLSSRARVIYRQLVVAMDEAPVKNAQNLPDKE